MSKKKILQINECLLGSTGNIARQIGGMAIESGWESWIAYSAAEPACSCNSQLIKVGSKSNRYIHYFSQRLFDNEGLNSKKETKWLIEQIKDIEPEVVHLHNLHDHWLNYQILFEYLNSTNIKVVWTFHDCWSFTGHCYHFITKSCNKWQTACFKCPFHGSSPRYVFDRSEKNFKLKKELFSKNKNLTVVAVSDWMASLVRSSFLKDKRIEVIHNGIDLNVFKPRRKRADDGTYRILAVSNVWNKNKGYYDILKLREALPMDFQISIVGLNERQVEGLPSGIKGIKKTRNVDELVELYSLSDVLINPTYADTFPTVNLEALACGTPVITYETGGSPESLDNKTGFVVEQGNVQKMAEAIIDLRKNPLSSADCRNRAELLFNKTKRFYDYIALYEQLL